MMMMKVMSEIAGSLLTAGPALCCWWRRDSSGYLDLVFFHGVAEPSKRGFRLFLAGPFSSRGKE